MEAGAGMTLMEACHVADVNVERGDKKDSKRTERNGEAEKKKWRARREIKGKRRQMKGGRETESRR